MDAERTCLDLALEGERHCKAGDCRKGVYFFEAAIQNGTSNLRTLSAIYSQMGNAYFYLQDYEKALEYHKHDLNLAKTINDKLGEAKANGNIGNTLKVLGQYDESLQYCQQHLKISSQLKDKIGEARALYNIANVLHAKAKAIGLSTEEEPGHYPPSVQDCLLLAVDNYLKNLALVSELNDKAAQGRVFGNLGNTYYLLGDFDKAIHYHMQRLAIAKEFGDKAAERRAYANLGNAYIFLGQFESAANQYKQTLQISRQLSDRALEAQACYSLGNTYTLLGDYQQAIEYHVLHLKIARELRDSVGEARACWSLGNAHTALGQSEQAMDYAVRHQDISIQIGDIRGAATAQRNLTDLKSSLGVVDAEKMHPVSTKSEDTIDAGPTRGYRSGLPQTADYMRSNEKSSESRENNKPKSQNVQVDVTPRSKPTSDLDQVPRDSRDRAKHGNEDDLFELISRSQSRRIDDQRCSIRHMGPVDVRPPNFAEVRPADGTSDSSRLEMPNRTPAAKDEGRLDEQFFDMLLRSQGSRLEDQRSSMRRPVAPTVPDNDFFNLVQRLQSNRLEGQRSTMPAKAAVVSTPRESSDSSQLRPPSVTSDKKSGKKGK